MSNRTSDPFDPEPEAAPSDEDDLYGRRDPRAGPGPFDPRGADRRPRPRGVPDFVRRAIENTVGSVQNTGSISRDALQYVLQQGDKGRKEVFRIVAAEVGDFLKNVDLSSEVVKVLTAVQVEFNASVRFRPNPEATGVKPEVESTTTITSPGEEPEARPDSDVPRAAGSSPSVPPDGSAAVPPER